MARIRKYFQYTYNEWHVYINIENINNGHLQAGEHYLVFTFKLLIIK